MWYMSSQGELSSSEPSPKERLLARVLDHLVEHGLEGFSLRSAAQAIGSSHRMLLYHFGSKEQLLVEVERLMRRRTAAFVEQQLGDGPVDLLRLARAQWRNITSDPRRLRLSEQLMALGILEPQRYRGMPSAPTGGAEVGYGPMQRALMEAGMPQRDARALGALADAAFKGLVTELLTTGDAERVEDALDLLGRLVTPLLAPYGLTGTLGADVGGTAGTAGRTSRRPRARR